MLPALRLTAEGECVIQEGVSLDLPPNNKFSVSYATAGSRQNSSSSAGSVSSPKEAVGIASDAGEVSDEGQDLGQEADGSAQDATLNEPPYVLTASTAM